MLSPETKNENPRAPTKPIWGGVFALSLGAFALVASEFMPVSLLTPVATDLGVSEGQAGQAISVSGAFAIIASLSISSIAGRFDRKILLLALTGMMIISGAVAALAPTYEIFLVGRAFIGISIGGFWSLSAATSMRLVPLRHVPRALAIVNGGNALATVIAAPLGSFLGSVIGWRGAFFSLVPIAIIVFLWQMFSLPSMRSDPSVRSSNIFRLLARPIVTLGMTASAVFFMGQFALFTYLRPFLETVVHVDVSTLSLLLLIMGIAGFIGTMFIGRALQRSVYGTLITIPAVMGLVAVCFLNGGTSALVAGVLLAIWGFLATSAPVGWWTWIANTLPDDAEAAGGLIVAIIQLAITLGAVLGGLLFDINGYRSTFGASASLLVIAALMTLVAWRIESRSEA